MKIESKVVSFIVLWIDYEFCPLCWIMRMNIYNVNAVNQTINIYWHRIDSLIGRNVFFDKCTARQVGYIQWYIYIFLTFEPKRNTVFSRIWTYWNYFQWLKQILFINVLRFIAVAQQFNAVENVKIATRDCYSCKCLVLFNTTNDCRFYGQCRFRRVSYDALLKIVGRQKIEPKRRWKLPCAMPQRI